MGWLLQGRGDVKSKHGEQGGKMGFDGHGTYDEWLTQGFRDLSTVKLSYHSHMVGMLIRYTCVRETDEHFKG